MAEPHRILIVDDDPMMRDFLARVLSRAGFDSEIAADGHEAMRALAGQSFDLVLTDLVMPGKEGLETLLEIKQAWPACKVIMISGAGLIGGMDFLDTALSLGADAALRKPVEPDAVVAAVRRVLGV